MTDFSVVNDSDHATLWAEAVTVLTQAIRLTCLRGDGTVEPADFADFLVTALVSAAANVGSVERVVAGRPGSWEAGLVRDLLRGVVGYEDEAQTLVGHRTEPVVVPLNVAQLVEDSGCLPTLLEALDGIGWPGDGTREHSFGEGATADELAVLEAATAALFERYRASYDAYAQVFADAVRLEEDGIEGLRVEIMVVIETDPEGADAEVQNPSEWDSDPLVWRLWSSARERAGTPQL